MHIRLREERKRLGLTLAQMAELGGVSPRAYSYYEKGEHAPDATFLAKIASVSVDDDKVDVFYVLTGQRIVSTTPAPHTQEEIEILVNYRRSREEDQRNIARTAELAGAAGKKPVPSRPSAREFGPAPDRGSQPRILGEKAAEPASGKARKK